MTELTPEDKLQNVKEILDSLRAADASVDVCVRVMRKQLAELGLTLEDIGTTEIELIGFEIVRIGISKAAVMAMFSGAEAARQIKALEVEELAVLARIYELRKSPGMPGI